MSWVNWFTSASEHHAEFHESLAILSRKEWQSRFRVFDKGRIIWVHGRIKFVLAIRGCLTIDTSLFDLCHHHRRCWHCEVHVKKHAPTTFTHSSIHAPLEARRGSEMRRKLFIDFLAPKRNEKFQRSVTGVAEWKMKINDDARPPYLSFATQRTSVHKLPGFRNGKTFFIVLIQAEGK